MSIPSVTTSWEVGYVAGDDARHAVRPTINGYRAWCGAGTIARFTDGRFASSDTGACPVCVDLVCATLPRPRSAAD